MSKISILVCLFCFPLFAFTQNGAFIVLQPTNIYEDAEMQNRVLRTSLRNSYSVLDFEVDKKSKLIKLQIAYPSPKQRITKAGFILNQEGLNEEEKNTQVQVFEEIPKGQENLANYLLISTNQIISKTRIENSEEENKLKWDKVEYRSVPNKSYWVYSNTGIYRPDMDDEELSKLYQNLVKRRLSYSRMVLILSGVVNVGSSKDWVQLALGKPIRIENPKKNQEDWFYTNQKIVFQRNRVSLIVYNSDFQSKAN